MRVAYVGHEALTFADYIDLEAGRTLHAEPGRVYDIAPASGRVVPEVPEPWFVAVVVPSWDTLELERQLASEPAPEAEASLVPEPEQDHPEG